MEITSHFAHYSRRALRLLGSKAITLVGSVLGDVTVIDVAGTGKFCTTCAGGRRQVGSVEGPIRPRGDRNLQDAIGARIQQMTGHVTHDIKLVRFAWAIL
jgi:hypothetical protein